jgi:hypothetical protein
MPRDELVDARTDDDGRADALHIHGKLGEELETLRLLERKLKRRRDQDLRERVRADMVAVAIEHVEAAIGALLRVGQEDDFAV